MIQTNLLLAAAVAGGAVLATEHSNTTPAPQPILPTVLLGGPTCDAGPVQFVECNGQITMIQLDGTASVGATSYLWETVCPGANFDDPTSATPILSIDVMGLCFLECGQISLTVSDGVSSSQCTTAVVISDTTPPMIVCPPDIVLPAGSPTGPAVTGTPAVTDACDPNPSLNMSDSTVMVGGQTIITRTWTTTDSCGNSVSCDQVITVDEEPPVEGDPGFDIKPGSCPNPVNVKSPGGVLPAGLLGNSGFDATLVDHATLLLSRTDGVGGSVAPIRTRISDVGTPFDGEDCDCHTLTGDGIADVGMKFLKSDVVSTLQLGGLGNKTFVELTISGQLIDGTSFSATDCIRITNPGN